MKTETPYNIFEGFDFEILNHPEFKEDSVREELIVPFIKALGYSSSKPYQIIRSRRLLHPFVSIGSQRKEIFIIPDYLFEVENKPGWILDAKSPTEEIINSIHVEQAYSYAIHNEVRVQHFALCNGKEFALYNVQEIKPVLHFPMKAIPMYWDSIVKYLSPENVLTSNPFHINKDFGLHLKRLGFDTFKSLIFPNTPITYIGQMDPDYFSTSVGIKIEDENYVVSFDFGIEIVNQLKGKIPDEAIDKLTKRISDSRTIVKFGDKRYLINIDCKVGGRLEENDKEIFLPLWINKIID